jgi:hypothetical protein
MTIGARWHIVFYAHGACSTVAAAATADRCAAVAAALDVALSIPTPLRRRQTDAAMFFGAAAVAAAALTDARPLRPIHHRCSHHHHRLLDCAPS